MKRSILLAVALAWGGIAGAQVVPFPVQPIPTLIPLFKCGPGFSTYSVRSLSGVNGDGVRCVKFHNRQTVGDDLAGVYWYGEGQWNGSRYRHVGYTYRQVNPFGDDTVGSYAADIFGNGENSNNQFSNLKVRAVQGLNRIRVTGGWSEEWILESSGRAATYRGNLNPVANCGSYLERAQVTDANGSTANGTGIRCMVRNSYIGLPTIWYGEGQWNGKRYRHFGITTQTQTWDHGLGTAADLCNDPSTFCGQTAPNGLQLQAEMGCGQMSKYRITGNWNERWNGSKRLDCVQ